MINESLSNNNETIWDKYGENLPSIFKRTIYRIPSTEELNEVNKFNLTPKDIIDGMNYTIVGRGINNQENKIKILSSIVSLSEMYPDNTTYKKAREILKLRNSNESHSHIK